MGGFISTDSRLRRLLMSVLFRMRSRQPRQNNDISIRISNVELLVSHDHIDLSHQEVVSDSVFVQTLQMHPHPGSVTQISVTGKENITAVPVVIGQFEHLETLLLQRNHITSISWAVVYLKSLRVLDVSYNLLTEVPRILGSLAKLEELSLQGNRLSRLPVELLKLTQLKRLDVSKNFKLFPPDKASIATNKEAIFKMLEKRLQRTNLWEGATPWVSDLQLCEGSVPTVQTLHELCVQAVLKYQLDFFSPHFVPPVVKNSLTEVEHAYRNSLCLTKCSNCKTFFSTKEFFDNHLC